MLDIVIQSTLHI